VWSWDFSNVYILRLAIRNYYNWSSLFQKSDQTNDVDRCHLDSGDPVKLIDGNCPHAICDLTQFTKCCYLFFQSFRTCQEVEALQLSLMVMLGSQDPSKIT